MRASDSLRLCSYRSYRLKDGSKDTGEVWSMIGSVVVRKKELEVVPVQRLHHRQTSG